MKSLTLIVGVLLLISSARDVRSRSAGPPLSSGTFDLICSQMMPSHSGASARSGNGGYTITTDLPRNSSDSYSYEAEQSYTVILSGTETFLGFLVIAHVPGQNGMLLGQFIPRNSNQQTLNCDAVGAATQATVTHSNSGLTRFSSMTFTWEAPAGADGTVDFRFTVVSSFSDFYVLQSAAANPGYQLTFSNPPNCELRTCAVFVGINPSTRNNVTYLELYLEGEAEGWVAVGFTETPNMGLADVVACNRDPATDMVEALDAWNIQGYGNEIDTVQDVVLASGDYTNQRISCFVAKKVAPSGTGQDLDLNNNYYILYGRRRGDSTSGSLVRHEIGQGNNPSISTARFNPTLITISNETGQGFPRMELLRFHGILMTIAWPTLSAVGIFFASWMKPALPNGEWFQVHRAFLLGSLFIGALGFAISFIASYANNISGLVDFQKSRSVRAHFAIGIIVMVLQIANPIIAIFRCKPGDKKRWIYNLIHGSLIGVIADSLAVTNCAIGTSLIFEGLTALFWVFISYVIVDVIILIVMGTIFIVKYYISKDSNNTECEKKDTELSTVGSDKEKKADYPDEDKPEKKVPSKDAPLRWAFLIVYLVLTTPLLIATIVLVAAGPA